MTKKEILKGNILIAEFMQFTQWVDSNRFMGYRNLDISKYNAQQEGMGSKPHAVHFNELKFHSSWDWLIPVVKKIKKYNSINPLRVADVMISYARIDIDELFERVVYFIKWYNSQPKT